MLLAKAAQGMQRAGATARLPGVNLSDEDRQLVEDEEKTLVGALDRGRDDAVKARIGQAERSTGMLQRLDR